MQHGMAMKEICNGKEASNKSKKKKQDLFIL